MTSRRTFLKFGGAIGAGILTPWGTVISEAVARTGHSHASALATATMLDSRSLSKYKDALPIPSVLEPTGKLEGSDYYEVAMTQFKQQLHSDLRPTTVWGYGDARRPSGSFPGPTLEVNVGQPILVKWINNIAASDHLLRDAYDSTLMGANDGEPHVKTVVHVHGAHVPTEGDGYPDAWFTRGFAKKGGAWSTEVYEYPNQQNAATLWYHDHAIAQTRLNVYAGLAGFYLIRSSEENSLPRGSYDIPLVIQDRMFDADGSLIYPVRDPSLVPTNADHPGPWIPEFFGDTILVNGKVWPFFEVEPRKYRFRILNGSNARFYNLRLSSGLPFTQIAAEQGLFVAPVQRRSILLAPAERADVIIDFAGQRGDIFLTNDAAAPFPDGDPVDPATTGQIMKFSIAKRLERSDRSFVPPKLGGAPGIPEKLASVTRNMTLVEFDDANGNPIIGLLNNRHWMSPITDKPKLGTVEIWNFINTTGDTHPIHLHLVKFQLLRRQKFDVSAYLAAWNPQLPPGSGPAPIAPDPYLLGLPITPESNETGFKDTVRANPGEVTTIIMRFDDYTGTYPWHCHILDHEDNDMMLQFEVV
jgi:spore coat protein A, manganese oxidase